MSYFSEESSVQAVNARMGPEVDARLRTVMTSLVAHLHAFAKETNLTQAEWELGIDFLTRTGQICSGERQEFILLSDVLGLSMLVDAINNRRPAGATENTVFGPFHVADAPFRAAGDSISLDGKGESCLFEGRVLVVVEALQHLLDQGDMQFSEAAWFQARDTLREAADELRQQVYLNRASRWRRP